MRRAMCLTVYLAASVGTICLGQTAVDLSRQSKSASAAPIQTGITLPSTCATGQMFFNSSAPAGQNLFGCTAANTWTAQAGSGSGGTLTVNSGTTTVGMRPIMSFTAGLGMLLSLSDTGTAISVQPSVDPAVVSTRAAEQTGGALLCRSSSGSATTYTCSLSPTLSSYTNGMVLHWIPDVAATGGATTLNVDTLGAVAVKLPDGTTDPTQGDVVAGRLKELWFDGTVFRMAGSVGPQGVLAEARPTCSASVRGRLWFVAGATGVKDSLSVCAQDATNALAWRSLY